MAFGIECRRMEWLMHKPRRRGQSFIELCFIVPWFLFLFIGALDMGFYAYALIAVQGAARMAALYTSSSFATDADRTGACTYVLSELQSLPNIGTDVSTCGTGTSVSTSSPVAVSATCALDATYGPIATVSVTYQSISMIPIPGILSQQLRLTRIVQMRVRNAATCTS